MSNMLVMKGFKPCPFCGFDCMFLTDPEKVDDGRAVTMTLQTSCDADISMTEGLGYMTYEDMRKERLISRITKDLRKRWNMRSEPQAI